MTYFYVDTETSGVDQVKNQILTMACEVCVPEKNSVVKEFQFGLLPDVEVNPKALEANGLTPEAIAAFPPCKQSFDALIRFLRMFVNPFSKTDKLTFVAYNARFDFDMLRELFVKCGSNYIGSYFWFPPIDIMNTAAEAVGDKRGELANFKLSTVAKYLGIEVAEESLHGALYDIQLAKQVREKSLQIIRERG